MKKAAFEEEPPLEKGRRKSSMQKLPTTSMMRSKSAKGPKVAPAVETRNTRLLPMDGSPKPAATIAGSLTASEMLPLKIICTPLSGKGTCISTCSSVPVLDKRTITIWSMGGEGGGAEFANKQPFPSSPIISN